MGASNDFQLSAPSTVNFNTGVNAGDDISIVLYFGHTLEEELFTATQGQKDFNLSGNIAASKNYKVFLNYEFPNDQFKYKKLIIQNPLYPCL